MRRLELLDYARLAAALSVLAFHYLFNGITNGKLSSLTLIPAVAGIAKYGYLGVDFFFMISGYVIFYTATGKTAGEFAASRCVRLYPAFWASVLVTSCFAMWLGGPAMSVTPVQVLANLTMLPDYLGEKPVDGVYWTLVLELKFYALVFGCLLVGLGRYLQRIFLLWPAAMLIAAATHLRGMPYLGEYYPYFAAGALFAMMRARVDLKALPSLSVCLFLCVAGALRRAEAAGAIRATEFSPIVIGAVIITFFAFFFVLNARRVLSLKLPGSRLAGGLTYPIYLVHAHVGYMLLSRFGTDENKVWVYPLVLAFVIALAACIHIFMEQRLSGLWQAVFVRWVKRPADAVQAVVGARLAPP